MISIQISPVTYKRKRSSQDLTPVWSDAVLNMNLIWDTEYAATADDAQDMVTLSYWSSGIGAEDDDVRTPSMDMAQFSSWISWN